MNEAKSKVLVIVEGKKTEPKLMKKLFSIYGIDKKHNIVSYNTKIYALYNQMFRDNPEENDILQVLKEHENDLEMKELLNERYSDIILIFDLEPQDPEFSEEKILEMMEFFVESSDMGKLYINYPMVESFYHMKSIPDPEYNSYIVTMDELKAGTYKSRVNRENRNRNYTKFAIDKMECNKVILQNVDKAWIISEDYHMNLDMDLYLPDPVKILNRQLLKIKTEDVVSVLCTCVFYIADYNPKFLLD
ncbi:hypothetical protein [Tissierella sp. Yu-01]|uniref:hypothetical protein n=1 Tax=Tissierella sp. Yu-01 TaxID=3035694 RepID=UPI00240DB2A8|nr:hypothetical protein [Tissierella sp. Yu-01]WFA07921.1 hypothetical protein P3962_09260 [Tissierella sp. Yu-01]